MAYKVSIKQSWRHNYTPFNKTVLTEIFIKETKEEVQYLKDSYADYNNNFNDFVFDFEVEKI